MALQSDILVIGGGINGAAVGYHLVSAGVGSVTLVEAHWPGYGASSYGDGIIRTHYADPADIALSLESLEVFRDWQARIGGTCGFMGNGFLWVATPAEASALLQNATLQREMGSQVEVLGEQDLRSLQPHLKIRDGWVGAYEPLSGGGDALAATLGLLRAAIHKGLILRVGEPVHELIASHGRVVGVETAHGRIGAGRIVLATGAWSPMLLSTIGARLPLVATRCCTGRVFLPELDCAPCNLIAPEVGAFLRITPNGQAHVPAPDAWHLLASDPDHFRSTVSRQALSQGLKNLEPLLPAATEAQLDRAWAGIDAVTPDARPVIGAVPGTDNLYIVAGSSFKGFKVAPAVGRLMAELIVSPESGQPRASPYSPERFSEGLYHWRESGYSDHLLA